LSHPQKIEARINPERNELVCIETSTNISYISDAHFLSRPKPRRSIVRKLEEPEVPSAVARITGKELGGMNM
jgi:hypothetical protein